MLESKRPKKFNAISVVLEESDAETFRKLCRITGVSFTEAVRTAVREFIPVLRKQANEVIAEEYSRLEVAEPND